MSRDIDIVYSPDDGGYYATRYPDGATTAVFASAEWARAAAAAGEWESERTLSDQGGEG